MPYISVALWSMFLNFKLSVLVSKSQTISLFIFLKTSVNKAITWGTLCVHKLNIHIGTAIWWLYPSHYYWVTTLNQSHFKDLKQIDSHVNATKTVSQRRRDSSLTFLWTYCCSFTSIYFAWPMAEPWKLENKLLFSESCQRWLPRQKVDCGTDILSDQEASSAVLLSPQLHTCPREPFVYLVYVGSLRRSYQSERWESCSFDIATMVGQEEEEKGKENRKLFAFLTTYFKVC